MLKNRSKHKEGCSGIQYVQLSKRCGIPINRTLNCAEIYICSKMNLVILSGSKCEGQNDQGQDAHYPPFITKVQGLLTFTLGVQFCLD